MSFWGKPASTTDLNAIKRSIGVVGIVALAWAVLAGGSYAIAQNSRATSAAKQSRPIKQELSSEQLASKTPDELAHYVFEHHGCKNCHTLGEGGKLGFTQHGQELGKNFEGCISLLTSMNVIAQTKPADRTAQDKEKAARFRQFGCTECHQITPGKMGLTAYGSKLKSLHMACTDVERILASKK